LFPRLRIVLISGDLNEHHDPLGPRPPKRWTWGHGEGSRGSLAATQLLIITIIIWGL